MKTYGNETHERFGNTAAYLEHEQKIKNYTKREVRDCYKRKFACRVGFVGYADCDF